MSWVTVIWSMVASACLTLAVIYGLAWCRNRTAWAHLLFSATAGAGAAFTFCELWLMRVETPAELLFAMKWSHVTMLLWLVSIIWFVTLYLGAGRRSVAWSFCGLRVLYLVVGFLFWPSVNYREITSLSRVPFLGDTVTVFTGIPNLWMLLGYSTMVMLLIYVAGASVTAWRRGDRRKALTIGGSVLFFLLLGNVETVLIYWAQLRMPIVLSPFVPGPDRGDGLRVEPRRAAGRTTRQRAPGQRGGAARE